MTPDRKEAAAKAVIFGAGGLPVPQGERCKRCHRPIREDGHAGYCCAACAQNEGEDLSQEKLRALVFERDKGVCREPGCGMDTIAMRARIDGLNEKLLAARDPKDADLKTYIKALAQWQAQVHQLVRLGFPRSAVETEGKTLWECAHVKSKVEGGSNDPRNCVTYCLAHHRVDTNALAKKRADSRKPKGRRFGR